MAFSPPVQRYYSKASDGIRSACTEIFDYFTLKTAEAVVCGEITVAQKAPMFLIN